MKRKETAIKLRRQGLTYTEISERLGSVPKGTLSSWLSGTQISNRGKQRLEARKTRHMIKIRKEALIKNTQKRQTYLDDLENQNRQGIEGMLKSISGMKLALAMLYLGEGGKQGGHTYFGNSDPLIVRAFLGLLRGAYAVDESKFRVTVQCRADQDVQTLEDFWSRQTMIPRQQFYCARIDPRTIGRPSRKKDYKGVCRVDYFSAHVFNELTVIAKIVSRAVSSVG